MSTRSITYVVEGETPIMALYRQSDGYVSGHGHDIAKFLAGHRAVNGHSGDPTEFNGPGDMAVRLITHLKGDANAVGNFYIVSPTVAPDQDYAYWITCNEGEPIRITVRSYDNEIFRGSPEELLAFEEE